MNPIAKTPTRRLFALVVIMLGYACGSSASSHPSQVILYSQHGSAVRVHVEIAATEEKRQMGLMYRRDLPELHGMLFLFPQERQLSFWMKNTPLPLDILYINAQRVIVNIAENTTPFSEISIPSEKPSQFVLEVNGGFSQRHGIATGDRVELPDNFPPVQ
ncbi:MAG: DUF192 domain-containing protein [Candidatus Binatia bacterium]